MGVEDVDPVTGRKTTGHEWNGITELDTPVPRGVLIFLIVTHIFAVLWWFLMPTWPLGSTYTKGLLGIDQRTAVAEAVAAARTTRAPWVNAIESSSFEEIRSNKQLMTVVNKVGRQLFGDNCAVCHGADGKGRSNYPDLTDDEWLWGGEPEKIEETMRAGINASHPDSRIAQMPSFGRDGVLDRAQVTNVANYVYSLSHPAYSTPQNVESIEAGREIFLTTCAACHGEEAQGNRDVGAPNLTDGSWLYGGDLQTIINSVHGGRQGHMPTWNERLSPAEIKLLALYVHSMGVENP